ncbi:MAG: ribosome recycling factor [Christensenellales bacterium]|jgi:ribosome recycling factor
MTEGNNIIKNSEERMQKSIQALNRELGGLRAGRANPQILDRIVVDYYGTPTPIQQLGNVSSPEPRMLVITVWDTGAMGAIEKAIQKSDLGINPTNDGKAIRLVFPELTEERRKELVKVVRKKGEEAKVAVRSIRRDANEQVKKERKESEITEDDQKVMEKEIQDVTDRMIKNIDNEIAEKEKEIMEI